MSRRDPDRYVVDGSGHRVGVILSLDEYERRIRSPRRRRDRGPKTRDLAAVAGRLKWKGDALAAQRALRDEW
jgi:hypothetical protein